jgi:hypothetical protein
MGKKSKNAGRKKESRTKQVKKAVECMVFVNTANGHKPNCSLYIYT